MKFSKFFQISILIIMLIPVSSWAELNWTGFITIGGVLADPDEGDSLDNYDDKFTFNNDTLIGLQVSEELNEKYSITAQMVARGVDEYSPEMAWAYITYTASENLKIKFGRFRIPLYLYSDFLDVGYAYHMASPPAEVYQNFLNSANGFDFVYEKQLGAVDTLFQFYVGSVDSTISSPLGEINVEVRNQTGFVGMMTFDWLTLRASINKSEVTFENFGETPLPNPFGDIDGLANVLNSLPVGLVGTGAMEAAENLYVDENDFIYSEMAAKAELNNFLFVAELVTLDVDAGPIADQTRWYVTSGYTLEDWMVYYTHAEASDDKADISASIPNIPTVTDGLILLVDGIADSSSQDQTTNSLGVRYDVSAGIAVKAEYSKIRGDSTSGGNIFRFVVNAVF